MAYSDTNDGSGVEVEAAAAAAGAVSMEGGGGMRDALKAARNTIAALRKSLRKLERKYYYATGIKYANRDAANAAAIQQKEVATVELDADATDADDEAEASAASSSSRRPGRQQHQRQDGKLNIGAGHCVFCQIALPLAVEPELLWPPSDAELAGMSGKKSSGGAGAGAGAPPPPPAAGFVAAAAVQCAACAVVGFARYCCKAHMVADRSRHSKECGAMRKPAVKKYLRSGRAAMDAMLADKRSNYTTGLSETPSSRVPCKRTMGHGRGGARGGGGTDSGGGSGGGGGGGGKGGARRKGGQGPAQQQQQAAAMSGGTRGGNQRSPLELYASRVQPGCELALKCQEQGAAAVQRGWVHGTPASELTESPSTPWVSFCSPTSVALNWLAPTRRGRFANERYVVQQQRVEACANDEGSEAGGGGGGGGSGRGGEWVTLVGDRAHVGFNGSHIVRALVPGTDYSFRVGLVENGGAAVAVPDVEAAAAAAASAVRVARWSPPSDPFTAGFADASLVEANARTLVGGSDFTPQEIAFFMTLDNPGKVQDYLDSFPLNHEAEDDTCLSALEAVRQNHAHCIEAAMLGAYILSLHGHRPLLMDMRASSHDDDHVVTPFQVNGRWGCLSKPNHAALRFRNAVYRSIRELMMSYFDEYLSKDGERSLRSYVAVSEFLLFYT